MHGRRRARRERQRDARRSGARRGRATAAAAHAAGPRDGCDGASRIEVQCDRRRQRVAGVRRRHVEVVAAHPAVVGERARGDRGVRIARRERRGHVEAAHALRAPVVVRDAVVVGEEVVRIHLAHDPARRVGADFARVLVRGERQHVGRHERARRGIDAIEQRPAQPAQAAVAQPDAAHDRERAVRHHAHLLRQLRARRQFRQLARPRESTVGLRQARDRAGLVAAALAARDDVDDVVGDAQDRGVLAVRRGRRDDDGPLQRARVAREALHDHLGTTTARIARMRDEHVTAGRRLHGHGGRRTRRVVFVSPQRRTGRRIEPLDGRDDRRRCELLREGHSVARERPQLHLPGRSRTRPGRCAARRIQALQDPAGGRRVRVAGSERDDRVVTDRLGAEVCDGLCRRRRPGRHARHLVEPEDARAVRRCTREERRRFDRVARCVLTEADARIGVRAFLHDAPVDAAGLAVDALHRDQRQAQHVAVQRIHEPADEHRVRRAAHDGVAVHRREDRRAHVARPDGGAIRGAPRLVRRRGAICRDPDRIAGQEVGGDRDRAEDARRRHREAIEHRAGIGREQRCSRAHDVEVVVVVERGREHATVVTHHDAASDVGGRRPALRARGTVETPNRRRNATGCGHAHEQVAVRGECGVARRVGTEGPASCVERFRERNAREPQAVRERVAGHPAGLSALGIGAGAQPVQRRAIGAHAERLRRVADRVAGRRERRPPDKRAICLRETRDEGVVRRVVPGVEREQVAVDGADVDQRPRPRTELGQAHGPCHVPVVRGDAEDTRRLARIVDRIDPCIVRHSRHERHLVRRGDRPLPRAVAADSREKVAAVELVAVDICGAVRRQQRGAGALHQLRPADGPGRRVHGHVRRRRLRGGSAEQRDAVADAGYERAATMGRRIHADRRAPRDRGIGRGAGHRSDGSDDQRRRKDRFHGARRRSAGRAG